MVHFSRVLLLGLLVFLVFLPSKVNAQDPAFSQFFSSPLQLNPAMAGMAFGPRGNLNYRNQWPSIQNGFVTYAASYDMHIDQIKGGVGLSIYHDRIANILNSTTIKLMYAYQLRLSKTFGIKFGIEGGIIHRSLDWNKLTFNDQIDPIYGFVNQSGIPNPTFEAQPASLNYIMPDFGAGFVAFSKKVYGGIMFRHITKPKDNFTDSDERLPILISVHGGYEITLKPNKRKIDFTLTPNIMLLNQSNFTQLNLGAILAYEFIYTGMSFRHTFNNTDAVIALLGFKIGYARIGYSFDITLSDLELSSGGAHEISVSFTIFGDDNSVDSWRRKSRMDCPGVLNF